MPGNRVTFYFDGFNFYNGLREKKNKEPDWRKFYWIDLVKFCRQFLSAEQVLVKVKYFTAPPLNIEKRRRQTSLFSVNKAINVDNFEIIAGKYYEKNIKCRLCGDFFKVPEEKRTDVNISVHLIGDCALDVTDTLVLISADSDLVPAIDFIRKNFPHKKIKIYFPPERSSTDLFNVINKKVVYLANNKKKFEEAILDNEITINDKSYFIPEKWV